LQLLERYSRLLIHQRTVITALVLSFTVVVAAGFFQSQRERFAGIKAIQSRQEDIREADELYQELRTQFNLQRPEQIVVMSTPRSLNQTDVEAMRRALGALKRLPQVQQAFWIDDLPTLNVFGLADPALPPDGASSESFEEAKAELLRNPLAVGHLISEDGKVLLAPLQMDWLQVTSDEDVREEILTTAKMAADQISGHTVEFSSTGDIPLFLDQMATHRWNQWFFQAVGFGLVLTLAVVIYRSIIPVILVSSAPALAIFWSLGILRWLNEPDNPLSDAVLPVLVAIVGITDGIHLLSHIRHALDEGASPKQAAASAVSHVGLACFLTSLTTAIGFASLMWADSDLVRGFGRSCAIGVTMAFLSMVTVLPLLAGTPLARHLPQSEQKDLVESKLGFWMTWVETWLGHRRLVSMLGILLTLGLSLSLFFVTPDEKRSFGLPTRSPSFRTLQLCDDKVGGIELARVVIQWPPPDDGNLEPPAELLELVQAVEGALASEPLLRHPLSIHQVLEAIPSSRQSDTPLDMLNLVPSALRQSLYREDLGRTVVSIRFQDVGIAIYEPVFERLRVAFDDLEAKFPGFEIRLTGETVVRSRKIVQVVRDLQTSLVGAAVIIFTLLAIVYRSWRIGLLAIVPNLLPIVATSSMLILFGRHLDVSAACAFTVCLGIAVDDTIHFVSRFLQEQKRTANIDEAIRVTYRKVGSALMITTVIMVVGFSTVLLSEMPAQRIFGAMAVCTIATALLGDLIFLPALLAWFYKQPRDSNPDDR
jgi:predicted RND superfamily exporter protein